MTAPVGTRPDPRWVAAADALAAALIRRAEPVRFTVAGTPAEVDDVLRLRGLISIEEGWRSPEELPDGRERDAYDDTQAIHVVGVHGGELAASARIVLPVAGRPLPTELAFEIEGGSFDDAVDVGRAIVARPYRERTHRVFGGLAGAVWRTVAAHGYRSALMAGTERTLGLVELLGLEVTIVGPPRRYWGALRYPARFAPPERPD